MPEQPSTQSEQQKKSKLEKIFLPAGRAALAATKFAGEFVGTAYEPARLRWEKKIDELKLNSDHMNIIAGYEDKEITSQEHLAQILTPVKQLSQELGIDLVKKSTFRWIDWNTLQYAVTNGGKISGEKPTVKKIYAYSQIFLEKLLRDKKVSPEEQKSKMNQTLGTIANELKIAVDFEVRGIKKSLEGEVAQKESTREKLSMANLVLAPWIGGLISSIAGTVNVASEVIDRADVVAIKEIIEKLDLNLVLEKVKAGEFSSELQGFLHQIAPYLHGEKRKTLITIFATIDKQENIEYKASGKAEETIEQTLFDIEDITNGDRIKVVGQGARPAIQRVSNYFNKLRGKSDKIQEVKGLEKEKAEIFSKAAVTVFSRIGLPWLASHAGDILEGINKAVTDAGRGFRNFMGWNDLQGSEATKGVVTAANQAKQAVPNMPSNPAPNLAQENLPANHQIPTIFNKQTSPPFNSAQPFTTPADDIISSTSAPEAAIGQVAENTARVAEKTVEAVQGADTLQAVTPPKNFVDQASINVAKAIVPEPDLDVLQGALEFKHLPSNTMLRHFLEKYDGRNAVDYWLQSSGLGVGDNRKTVIREQILEVLGYKSEPGKIVQIVPKSINLEKIKSMARICRENGAGDLATYLEKMGTGRAEIYLSYLEEQKQKALSFQERLNWPVVKNVATAVQEHPATAEMIKNYNSITQKIEAIKNNYSQEIAQTAAMVVPVAVGGAVGGATLTMMIPEKEEKKGLKSLVIASIASIIGAAVSPLSLVAGASAIGIGIPATKVGEKAVKAVPEMVREWQEITEEAQREVLEEKIWGKLQEFLNVYYLLLTEGEEKGQPEIEENQKLNEDNLVNYFVKQGIKEEFVKERLEYLKAEFAIKLKEEEKNLRPALEIKQELEEKIEEISQELADAVMAQRQAEQARAAEENQEKLITELQDPQKCLEYLEEEQRRIEEIAKPVPKAIFDNWAKSSKAVAQFLEEKDNLSKKLQDSGNLELLDQDKVQELLDLIARIDKEVTELKTGKNLKGSAEQARAAEENQEKLITELQDPQKCLEYVNKESESMQKNIGAFSPEEKPKALHKIKIVYRQHESLITKAQSNIPLTSEEALKLVQCFMQINQIIIEIINARDPESPSEKVRQIKQEIDEILNRFFPELLTGAFGLTEDEEAGKNALGKEFFAKLKRFRGTAFQTNSTERQDVAFAQEVLQKLETAAHEKLKTQLQNPEYYVEYMRKESENLWIREEKLLKDEHEKFRLKLENIKEENGDLLEKMISSQVLEPKEVEQLIQYFAQINQAISEIEAARKPQEKELTPEEILDEMKKIGKEISNLLEKKELLGPDGNLLEEKAQERLNIDLEFARKVEGVRMLAVSLKQDDYHLSNKTDLDNAKKTLEALKAKIAELEAKEREKFQPGKLETELGPISFEYRQPEGGKIEVKKVSFKGVTLPGLHKLPWSFTIEGDEFELAYVIKGGNQVDFKFSWKNISEKTQELIRAHREALISNLKTVGEEILTNSSLTGNVRLELEAALGAVKLDDKASTKRLQEACDAANVILQENVKRETLKAKINQILDSNIPNLPNGEAVTVKQAIETLVNEGEKGATLGRMATRGKLEDGEIVSANHALGWIKIFSQENLQNTLNSVDLSNVKPLLIWVAQEYGPAFTEVKQEEETKKLQKVISELEEFANKYFEKGETRFEQYFHAYLQLTVEEKKIFIDYFQRVDLAKQSVIDFKSFQQNKEALMYCLLNSDEEGLKTIFDNSPELGIYDNFKIRMSGGILTLINTKKAEIAQKLAEIQNRTQAPKPPEAQPQKPQPKGTEKNGSAGAVEKNGKGPELIGKNELPDLGVLNGLAQLKAEIEVKEDSLSDPTIAAKVEKLKLTGNLKDRDSVLRQLGEKINSEKIKAKDLYKKFLEKPRVELSNKNYFDLGKILAGDEALLTQFNEQFSAYLRSESVPVLGMEVIRRELENSIKNLEDNKHNNFRIIRHLLAYLPTFYAKNQEAVNTKIHKILDQEKSEKVKLESSESLKSDSETLKNLKKKIELHLEGKEKLTGQEIIDEYLNNEKAGLLIEEKEGKFKYSDIENFDTLQPEKQSEILTEIRNLISAQISLTAILNQFPDYINNGQESPIAP